MSDGQVTATIHPTAIVDPAAELGEGVSVGPQSIIGPGVTIGARTVVGSSVLIERDTHLGEDCQISHGAVLGTAPQDLKYRGEPSTLQVGDRTTIREYATLNRGTAALGTTRVGSDCLLMAYSHVAHDCVLGDRVIVSNAVNMGGHVVIEDWATVGGLTAVHQFVRIGAHAFVGGASRIPKDVAPYALVAGSPAKMYGLNSVGLERRGFSEETRAAIKRAHREIFRSEGSVAEGLERVRAGGLIDIPEIRTLVEFVESSERGVTLG